MRRHEQPIERAPSCPRGDGEAIEEAALALGVLEIDFFRIAWQRSRGFDPATAEFDRVFEDYVFNRTIPAWVVEVANEVLDARDHAALDPTAFGAAPYQRRARRFPGLHLPNTGLKEAVGSAVMLMVFYGMLGLSLLSPATADEGGAALEPCRPVETDLAVRDFAEQFEAMHLKLCETEDTALAGPVPSP